MAPESPVATLERWSEHNFFGVKPKREAAKDAWRVSEIQKSVNPADQTPLPRDVQGATADAYSRFEPEYEAIRSQPIPGETVTDMPKAALRTPGGVPDSVKQGAAAAIDDALTVLPGYKSTKAAGHGHHGHGAAPEGPPPLLDAYSRPVPPAPQPPTQLPDMTAGDLMKVRSELRTRMRAERSKPSPDFDKLNQLGHAHDVVTQTLEQSLTPEQAAALKDVDRRYATLMTIEHAAPAGQTDFTPGQLLRSAEKSAGRRSFKQGNAGALQQGGEAAREVFEGAPKTGAIGSVLGSIPGMHYAAAPLAQLANTELGKRILFSPLPSFLTPPGPPVGLAVQGRFFPRSMGLEPIPVRADDRR
jgi:hypothetical protein